MKQIPSSIPRSSSDWQQSSSGLVTWVPSDRWQVIIFCVGPITQHPTFANNAAMQVSNDTVLGPLMRFRLSILDVLSPTGMSDD
jgi:hypothetical protein